MRRRALKQIGLVTLALSILAFLPANTVSAGIWTSCFECGESVGVAICRREYDCCGGWTSCHAFTRCFGSWPFRECFEICILSGDTCLWA